VPVVQYTQIKFDDVLPPCGVTALALCRCLLQPLRTYSVTV